MAISRGRASTIVGAAAAVGLSGLLAVLGGWACTAAPPACPAPVSGGGVLAAAPGFAPAPTGVEVPDGFREWAVIAPSYRSDKDEVRVILGNDAAVAASRAGTLPFPDGAVLAKLAWAAEDSPEFDGALMPGAPARIEFMVKDARRWPETAGWGFGRWVEGRPADQEAHATCFGCHEANVRDNDFVFTRWAP